MLGIGTLGQFPLGGGPYGQATITTIGWFSPISEPVRFKRPPRAAVAVNNQTLAFNPLPVVSFGWFDELSEPTRRRKLGLSFHEQPVLAFNPQPFVSFGWFNELSKPQKLEKPGLKSSYQQTLAFNPAPLVSFGWFGNLSDPVRVKPRLRESLQEFLAYQANPTTVTPFAWYANLSDPVRIKPGLRKELQQAFAADTDVIPVSKLIQWFGNLSDPVRIKPGLKASLQQFLAAPSRLIPTPTSFGVMSALETKDIFLAGAMTWNRITDTEIGVVNTTPQPAEISLSPTAPAAGTITVRISVIIG